MGKFFFFPLEQITWEHTVFLSHQLQHVKRPKALVHKAHFDTHESCLHAETCSETQALLQPWTLPATVRATTRPESGELSTCRALWEGNLGNPWSSVFVLVYMCRRIHILLLTSKAALVSLHQIGAAIEESVLLPLNEVRMLFRWYLSVHRKWQIKIESCTNQFWPLGGRTDTVTKLKWLMF